MTKKDAAVQVWGVARRLRLRFQGNEEIDSEIMFLLSIAEGLDPHQQRYKDDYIKWALDDKPNVEQKLRNLIEHPQTPPHEREAAVTALHRLRVKA